MTMVLGGVLNANSVLGYSPVRGKEGPKYSKLDHKDLHVRCSPVKLRTLDSLNPARLL